MIARMAGLLIAALFALPADAKSTPIIKAENAALGRHLTDGSGVSVYLFEADHSEGDQRRSIHSNCVGDCLILWPPVPGDPLPVAGVGVDAQMISSFRRADGMIQASYRGRPLYYFAEDFIAGDINGQQFQEFGGNWYLVTPIGQEFGGKLASGDSQQGVYDCVCHGTEALNLAPASREFLAPAPKPKSKGPRVLLGFVLVPRD